MKLKIFIFLLLIITFSCNPFDVYVSISGDSKLVGAKVYLNEKEISKMEYVKGGSVTDFYVSPGEYELKIISINGKVIEKKIKIDDEIYIGITDYKISRL